MRIIPTAAPNTPLNLQFGVLYAPRVPTPPFEAFEAVQIQPEQWNIRAYDTDGNPTITFCGSLMETYGRLAAHLRMDVPAGT